MWGEFISKEPVFVNARMRDSRVVTAVIIQSLRNESVDWDSDYCDCDCDYHYDHGDTSNGNDDHDPRDRDRSWANINILWCRKIRPPVPVPPRSSGLLSIETRIFINLFSLGIYSKAIYMLVHAIFSF